MITFSIVIPITHKGTATELVESLKEANYPQKYIEVIIAKGYIPSAQRNAGVKIAQGDIVCFFNHDCVLPSNFFNEVIKTFQWRGYEHTGAVGGPAIILENKCFLNGLFICALGSYFVHFCMRARYKPIGKKRESSEKELIGCNISARRDVFEKMNGFNEELYPNEENELLNRIQHGGYKLIYNPDLRVYRNAKQSLFSFVRKMCRNGRGRARQILKEPLYFNLIFYLPLLFFSYLVILILPLLSGGEINSYFIIPVAFYIFGTTISACVIANQQKKTSYIFLFPAICFLMHVSYAIGMFSEFFQHLFRLKRKNKILIANINKIKEFRNDWLV